MTIRHIVLFTLNEGIERHDPRVLEAAKLSESHHEHISEILTWQTGFDVSGRSISADFAVAGTFNDASALARYMDHPHHRKGVEAWRDLASWTVIDLDEDHNGEV